MKIATAALICLVVSYTGENSLYCLVSLNSVRFNLVCFEYCSINIFADMLQVSLQNTFVWKCRVIVML